MSPETPTPPPGESRGNGRFGSRPGLAPVDHPRAGRPSSSAPSSSSSSPRRPAASRSATATSSQKLQANEVKGADANQADATFDNTNGHISGTLTDGSSFTTTGPLQPPDADHAAHDGEGRRLLDPHRQPAEHPAAAAASRRPAHRLLRLDAAPGPGPDGRHHVHRAEQGQDLLHRAAGHDLRRRRRLRGREAGDHRGRRLPEAPREVRRDRRPHPQGRAARRPPGHRQDPHRPGRRRRGRRAVPLGHRLGLHGDVRGRRRQPRPRPVPDRPQDGPGHHLRGRDRLHRPQARRRPRRRPRRAGADAQPDALRDGRLRGHHRAS